MGADCSENVIKKTVPENGICLNQLLGSRGPYRCWPLRYAHFLNYFVSRCSGFKSVLGVTANSFSRVSAVALRNFYIATLKQTNKSPLPAETAQSAQTWLRGERSRTGFPAETKDLYLFRNVPTGSGAHPASNSIGICFYTQGAKRPWREADHSTPSSPEVKNEWSYTSAHPLCLHILHLLVTSNVVRNV